MTKNTMTDEQTRQLVEAVKKMNPDDLFAICDAVIKKENAKKARRQAKEAEAKAKNIGK